MRVLAVLRPGRDPSPLPPLAELEVRHGDLAEPASLRGAFDGAGAVVHLAGLALVPGMLPAIESAGVAAGVFVSSAGVYTKLASRGPTPSAPASRRCALRRSHGRSCVRA